MAPIPKSLKKDLSRVAKILNIGWLERGIDNEARVICPRSGACPRDPKCGSAGVAVSFETASETESETAEQQT